MFHPRVTKLKKTLSFRPNSPSVHGQDGQETAQKLRKNIRTCQQTNVSFPKRFTFLILGTMLFLIYPIAMLGNAYNALNGIFSHWLLPHWAMTTLTITIMVLLLALLTSITSLYGNAMLRYLRRRTVHSKKVYKLYQNIDRAYDFAQHFNPEERQQPHTENESRFARFLEIVYAETFEHLLYNASKDLTLHKKTESTFTKYCDKLKEDLKTTDDEAGEQVYEQLNHNTDFYPKKYLDHLNEYIAKPFMRCLSSKDAKERRQNEDHYFIGLLKYMEALRTNKVAEFIDSLGDNDIDNILYYQYTLLDEPLLAKHANKETAQYAQDLIILRIKLRAWRWVKLFLWQDPFWPRVISFLTYQLNPLINASICFFSALTLALAVHCSLTWALILAGLSAIIGFTCSHLTTAKACIKRFCRAQRWYRLRQYWQEFKIEPYMIICLICAGLMTLGSIVIAYYAVSSLLIKTHLAMTGVYILSSLGGLLIGICAFGLYVGSAIKLCSKQSFPKTLNQMVKNPYFWWSLPAALAKSSVIGYQLYQLSPFHGWLFWLLATPILLCATFTLTLCYTQEQGDFIKELTQTSNGNPFPLKSDKAYYHLERDRQQFLKPMPKHSNALTAALAKNPCKPIFKDLTLNPKKFNSSPPRTIQKPTSSRKAIGTKIGPSSLWKMSTSPRWSPIGRSKNPCLHNPRRLHPQSLLPQTFKAPLSNVRN